MAWEREILSLRVKCKKSERGCEWTGEIRSYQVKGWQVVCFLISVMFSVGLAVTFDLAAFLVSMDAFH